MYKTLLKILENKERYDRFAPQLKDHTLPQETREIVKAMGEWHKLAVMTAPDDLDWDTFITWFKLHKIGHLSADKHLIYDECFNKVDEPFDEDEVKPVMNALIEKDYAVRMADHLLKIAEGDDTRGVDEVATMLDSYNSEVEAMEEEDDGLVKFDFFELIKPKSKDGLGWRLNELNISVGPLEQGDFCVFVAAPNAGKTTMLASELSYMAGQLPPDRCVLLLNNEERGSKIQKRIFQAAIGWTQEDMDRDPTGAHREVCAAINGDPEKIKVFDPKVLTITNARAAIKKYNPGLILFDQLWKVKGMEKHIFSESQLVSELFAWGRQVAKEFAPVITVHQADGTAQGELYIEQHQLYMSRVAAQGEMDAIITLGRSRESTNMYERGLSVAKNKMDISPGIIPDQREGRWLVEIDPFTARFMGKW